MCDIFIGHCVTKDCEAEFDVHIADFCLPQDAFELFCKRHCPPDADVRYRCRGGRRGHPKFMAVRYLRAIPDGYDRECVCFNGDYTVADERT